MLYCLFCTYCLDIIKIYIYSCVRTCTAKIANRCVAPLLLKIRYFQIPKPWLAPPREPKSRYLFICRYCDMHITNFLQSTHKTQNTHRTPNTTHHTLPYTHEHYSSSVCDHHTYCVWILSHIHHIYHLLLGYNQFP